MQDETLPQLLLVNARGTFSRKPAIREKEFGIWQEYRWADALKRVKAFALGLVALGFKRGETLALLSDNRPEVYWAILAIQAIGGVPVPIYQDAPAKEVGYIIDHSDASFVFAQDQEQVDKVLELKEVLPRLKQIIYEDPKGMRHYQDALLRSFTAVEGLGRRLEQEQPGLFEALVEAGRREDVALLCYTSGTTGLPKGVVLLHRNLITVARNFLATKGCLAGDAVLAYLPPAWIGEILWSLAVATVAPLTVNCPEGPETVQGDLREVGPHLFFAPPRIWENLASQVQVRMEDAGFVKRRFYRWFLPIGHEAALRKMQGRPVPLWLKFLSLLGEVLVYGPIRDQLGLARVKSAYTGGAAIGPEIFMLFRSIGINVKQAYGQTECSALACLQQDDQVKLETVGRPVANTEVRISDEGEVLIRSSGLFAGYYKNPTATALALKEGWLHTGDAGLLGEDGHLVCLDRAGDLATLVDGTQFAPQMIENKLKFSPYIKEAVVIGQGRPYVAALIDIDEENVGKWAEKRRVSYTTYADLSQKPEVCELVHWEIERVNRDLSSATRIRRYLLLHKELDPDDEEMTRTRKVRRRFVTKKYSGLIEALYAGLEEVPVLAEVTYQDGRKATIETRLKIRALEKMAEVGRS
ncbi:MAG: AMP-binding protein [candidate division NC10 bacterium]|nr:AMP-binding protein [candidate division NC10 bacterium]